MNKSLIDNLSPEELISISLVEAGKMESKLYPDLKFLIERLTNELCISLDREDDSERKINLAAIKLAQTEAIIVEFETVEKLKRNKL